MAGVSVIFKKRLDRKGRECNASYTQRADPSVLPIPCGSLLEGSTAWADGYKLLFEAAELETGPVSFQTSLNIKCSDTDIDAIK